MFLLILLLAFLPAYSRSWLPLLRYSHDRRSGNIAHVPLEINFPEIFPQDIYPLEKTAVELREEKISGLVRYIYKRAS